MLKATKMFEASNTAEPLQSVGTKGNIASPAGQSKTPDAKTPDATSCEEDAKPEPPTACSGTPKPTVKPDMKPDHAKSTSKTTPVKGPVIGAEDCESDEEENARLDKVSTTNKLTVLSG